MHFRWNLRSIKNTYYNSSIKKTNEAISTFKQFDLNKNNAFTPFVKWYLALAYLKTNEKENAKLLLESLVENANPQQEMAQKLLTELE